MRQDSIVMVKDAKTGDIGFVFPYKIAIDYRNLVTNLVPSLEEKITLQEKQVAKLNQVIGEKDNEIQLLGKNVDAERQKYTEKDNLCKIYEKELRSKKFWKTASMVLAGATAVLLVTTILK